MIEGLPVTIADIVVVGGILLFGILSAFWGFVGLVTGIGAWAGAAMVTLSFYEKVSDFSRTKIEEVWLADIAAGGGLFIGSLLIFMILSAMISSRIEDSKFGSINRALGLISGLVIGYGVAAVMLLAAIWLFEEQGLPRSVKEARAYDAVRAGSMMILEKSPTGLQERVRAVLEEGRDAAGEAARLKKLMDAVENPDPGANSGDASSGETGYNDQDRSQLEQKIEEYSE